MPPPPYTLQNNYIYAEYDTGEWGGLNSSDRTQPGLRFVPGSTDEFTNIWDEIFIFPLDPDSGNDYWYLNYTYDPAGTPQDIVVTDGLPDTGTGTLTTPAYSNTNQTLTFGANETLGGPNYLEIRHIYTLLGVGALTDFDVHAIKHTVTLHNVGSVDIGNFLYFRTFTPRQNQGGPAFLASVGGNNLGFHASYNDVMPSGLALNSFMGGGVTALNDLQRQWAVGSGQTGTRINFRGNAALNDPNADPTLTANYYQDNGGSFSTVGSPVVSSDKSFNVFYANIPLLHPTDTYTIGPYYFIFGGGKLGSGGGAGATIAVAYVE
jgi:hypothetical protein